MFLETIKRLFSRGRLNKDSFSNYYKDVFVNEDMLVVILIDMQQYFIRGLKKENKERIIANQIFIIKWCAQENIPIVVLEYEKYGKTIDVLIKELKEVKYLRVISKSRPDGFYDTKLAYTLNQVNADNLFLMGIDANVCVRSTAIGAMVNGFKFITSEDVIDGVRNDDNSIPWYRENGTVVSVKGLTN